MIEPNEKTKYFLRNWNPTGEQEEEEYFDTIEQVVDYLNKYPSLPEDYTVFELTKEIKFKLVPA